MPDFDSFFFSEGIEPFTDEDRERMSVPPWSDRQWAREEATREQIAKHARH